MRIIQLLTTVSYGDAVSNDAIALRDILIARGFHTRIYAENIARRVYENGLAYPVGQMPVLYEDDVLIYHLSTGTPLNARIPDFRCRKICVYHNITPPRFFEGLDERVRRLTSEGYEQTRALAGAFDYCLADSAYNRQDLLDMGWTCPIDVLPVLIPFDDYKAPCDTHVMRRYADDAVNVLFTGRIAPNKKQDDVIRAFALYQRHYQPNSRLFLVGSYGPEDPYYLRLRALIEHLGVKNVVMPGHIPFAQILSYYHMADLFLCMSEHEGFCVPVVEAMFFGIPVVAYDMAAVGETLGGGGLLLPREPKSPALAAAALDRVWRDDALREKIRQGQERRLEDFSHETVSRQFCGYLDQFLQERL